MKNLSVLAISIFILIGCGGEGGTKNPTKNTIQLHIVLPASISKSQERYRRFLARVESLEVQINSKEGYHYENHFPPGQWNSLSLPAANFPNSSSDKLTIKIQVWDRKIDGLRRSYAVLTGSQMLNANEVEREGVVEVPIKLSLQVLPENYD